jgi:hypothetical protein
MPHCGRMTCKQEWVWQRTERDMLFSSFASDETTGSTSLESITQQIREEIAKLSQVLHLLEGGAKPRVAKQATAPRRKISASRQKEDRTRTACEVGEVEGYEEEISGLSSLRNLLRRRDSTQFY